MYMYKSTRQFWQMGIDVLGHSDSLHTGDIDRQEIVTAANFCSNCYNDTFDTLKTVVSLMFWTEK